MTSELALAKSDERALSDFTEKNKPLIYSIVNRFSGRGAEKEDLFQLGCIGFIKAVRDYDENFGTAFSTYAVPKIAGEIKRFLRDDGVIKVSRKIKEKNVKINAASAAFQNAYGKSAKVSDICDMTGLSPDDVVFCQSAGVAVSSLDAEDGLGRTCLDVINSGETEDERVQAIALKSAVNELPEELKRIIGLRYYHGLSQQKTAEITGLSQVQISRKEKKAIELLKVKLKEDFT